MKYARVNGENKINVNIKNNTKILPITNIDTNINEYEQYVKEKKESQIYRLSFNITPLCSNVLFNKITEIVYHEGADDCIVFNKNGNKGNIEKNTTLKEYCNYKDIQPTNLKREDLIRDTGFSHPKCGGLVYHCGYDIFNNHMLRKKVFNNINKLSDKNTNEVKQYFNTLYDLKRDKNGDEVKNQTINNVEFNEHLYLHDTIFSFEESINENLIEDNGWIGFINPNTLNVPNYKNIALNKCMNNNKACEIINMYPDKSLFSFVPKINKYRNNRVEKNWDYCLTYPFENFYDNELVQYKCDDNSVINGLKAIIIDDIFNSNFIEIEKSAIITLKTVIKHNLSNNSYINIVLIGKDANNKDVVIKLNNNEKIIKLGYNGENKDYFFSIYSDEIIDKLNNFRNPSDVEIRIRQVNNSGICEYYFRKFRRIPNFTNSDIYIDDCINIEDVKKNSNKNFNNSINALGFSRTIYNDRNVQIIYNDDINLKGLKDNLGRDISEIYLTIIKNNNGHDLWYNNNDYTNSGITNSRCFGKITSGVEMLDSEFVDYNIHVINNVSTNIIKHNKNSDIWDFLVKEYYRYFFKEIHRDNNIRYETPKVLEDNINAHGNNDNNDFLGDIIEFNKDSLTEHVLTDVFHRFNTVQREMYVNNDEFDINIDEIYYDDYDVSGSGFTFGNRIYNEISDENAKIKIPINIDAEGYYYKPHYKIELKQYKNIIKQGSHTKIGIIKFEKNGSSYQITTNKNYFFETFDEIYFYHKTTKEKIIGQVIKVGGKNKTEIYVNIKLPVGTITDYNVYKPNSEKPYGAYDLNDGSGIYLWKELLEDHEYDIDSEISKYVFTNNAHYINKQIIFKLHRQDPKGDYLISAVNAPSPIINNLAIVGEGGDYSNIETMLSEIKEGGLLC